MNGLNIRLHITEDEERIKELKNRIEVISQNACKRQRYLKM